MVSYLESYILERGMTGDNLFDSNLIMDKLEFSPTNDESKLALNEGVSNINNVTPSNELEKALKEELLLDSENAVIDELFSSRYAYTAPFLSESTVVEYEEGGDSTTYFDGYNTFLVVRFPNNRD